MIISHNAPVTVLTELGSVGFALFLVLLGWTAVTIGRAARAPGPEGLAEWVMLALLAAIFVHSLLYSALFEDPYTWVVTAAGHVQREQCNAAESSQTHHFLPTSAGGATRARMSRFWPRAARLNSPGWYAWNVESWAATCAMHSAMRSSP